MENEKKSKIMKNQDAKRKIKKIPDKREGKVLMKVNKDKQKGKSKNESGKFSKERMLIT